MRYHIQYSCISDVGKCRRNNQDNFICGKTYMDPEEINLSFPVTGDAEGKEGLLLGIFDGMGGEECGEVASLIAARKAAGLVFQRDMTAALHQYCLDANDEICRYTEEHNLFSMGTTAALLAFTRDNITLCNIGDSRIYCFADDKLEQISVDHVAFAAYGRKPPLSQNLGIPPTELNIDPYIVPRDYGHGEMYLICSDGLTDMVEENEIESMMRQVPFDELPALLVETALSRGGRDNITLILCRIEGKPDNNLKKSFAGKPGRGTGVGLSVGLAITGILLLAGVLLFLKHQSDNRQESVNSDAAAEEILSVSEEEPDAAGLEEEEVKEDTESEEEPDAAESEEKEPDEETETADRLKTAGTEVAGPQRPGTEEDSKAAEEPEEVTETAGRLKTAGTEVAGPQRPGTEEDSEAAEEPEEVTETAGELKTWKNAEEK